MSPHLNWETLGGRALSADERAHASACDTCRPELARMAALRVAIRSSIPVDLAARVQLAAATELARRPQTASWLRGANSARAWAALAMLPALLLPLRSDWASLDTFARVGTGLLTVAAFVLAVESAFRPGLRARVLTPLALAVAVAVALVVTPGPRATDASGLHPSCLLAVVASSAAPLAALLAILRRHEINRVRGMLAALAAGALGEWIVYRHCELGSIEHMLGSHLAGWAILLGLGGWLGERVRIPLLPESRAR